MRTTEQKLRDRIWITQKCRINAENRYRTYNTVAHVMAVYFSLLLIAVSVLAEELRPHIGYFDKINLVLSILVFALSLALYGFGFSGRAKLHRECYLKLQRILQLEKDIDALGLQYMDILDNYPNQSDRDHDDLLVIASLFNRKPITSPDDGTPLNPGCLRIIKFFLRKFAFWGITIASVVAPVSLLIWILCPSCRP